MTYPRQDHLLAMGVEAGVGETLPLVLAEEARVTQLDVVDLVARTLAVQPVPVLL